MSETNYERLFGTPEKAARTIAENCGSDCWCCIVAESAPCYKRFLIGEDDVPEMLEWLESEAE